MALAIFIPASGWTADRFGARNVFRVAIAIFMCGSIGCAMAHSLSDFVIARFVQGMGGAMMSPIGRLVLLRSFDKREIVAVMTWVTMPALIGPVLGPPVGGFITTYFSWHWIFVINIPIGLLGIALVTRFIPEHARRRARAVRRHRFRARRPRHRRAGVRPDHRRVNYLPAGVVVALVVVGAISTLAYVRHARRTPAPLLDISLFSLATFRASVLGGFIFRIGVGALPFLLPLLLQLGFNMTPFESGLITFSTALGAMSMKAVVPAVLRQFGFRWTLTVNAILSAAFLAACAGFRPGTPVVVMMAVLVIGGFFRSLEFTSINTIAYAEIDKRRMSRATSLVSVAQQLSMSTGIAVGALAVELDHAVFRPRRHHVPRVSRPHSCWSARCRPRRPSSSSGSRRMPVPNSPTARRGRPRPRISGWDEAGLWRSAPRRAPQFGAKNVTQAVTKTIFSSCL